MSSRFQGTAQWINARIGKLTASRAYPVIARTRQGKKYADWERLAREIVQERVTLLPADHGTTAAMQWGVDHEDEARSEYELATGRLVIDAPFVEHPTLAGLGASPDGYVGRDGLLEIKCPNSGTHLERLEAGIVPPEYVPQMLVQCLCTGRKWVDFVDYDPRIAEAFAPMRLFIIRYTPTAEELQEALDRCREFLEEVDRRMARYRARCASARPASSSPTF